MVKLLVGGLAWHTTDETLRHAFERFGEVEEATVVQDHDTQRSRGFGFVIFRHEQHAVMAQQAMNNEEFDGRRIRVDYASRERLPGRGGAFLGRGGYSVLDLPRGNSISIGRPWRNELIPSLPESVVEETVGSELRDYRTLPMLGRSGLSAVSIEERPPKDTSLIGQLPQVTTFDWELPSLLGRISSTADGHAIKDSVLKSVTLLASEDFVELMTCGRYLEEFHPDNGKKFIEAFIDALITSEKIFLNEETVIEATPERLTITTSSEDSQVNKVAVWLCLTFRAPKNGSHLIVSTGSFEGRSFKMRDDVVFSATCWSKLFHSAVVTVMPDHKPPASGLLKLSFEALLQLAAVEYPVQIDTGLVLMGYSTALVPVELGSNGQVIWHVEIATDDKQIQKHGLQATRGPWLQRLSLEELHTTEALLGWCASAQVRLGSDSLDPHVTWSDAKVKPTTWRWRGANLQLLAQSASPIQIGAQAGFSWERVINTVRFTPGGNYTRCLANSRHEPAILYDVNSQRAWLVTLTSIYHHMLLAYHSMISQSGDQKPVPVITSSDGPSGSWDVLQASGGVIVEGSGEDILTVRELIMGFSINFSMASLQPPKGARIYGYELMDVVMGSPRGELKTVSVEQHGLGWLPLLNEVSCLFCAGLGDAIVGARASSPGSPCNYLPAGQNLLASTVEALEMLCRKQGRSLTSACGQVTRQHVLAMNGHPFIQCLHSAKTVSCWECSEGLVQQIQRGVDAKSIEGISRGAALPNHGAVVLGTVRSKRFL